MATINENRRLMVENIKRLQGKSKKPLNEALSSILLKVSIPIKGESETKNIEFDVLTPGLGYAIPSKEIQLVPKDMRKLFDLFPSIAGDELLQWKLEPDVYPQIIKYASKKLGVDVKKGSPSRSKGFIILVDLKPLLNKLK